jgi:ribosome-binding factor A
MRQRQRQYKRSVRFNRLLQEEISDIIQRRLKDPRIGLASITRVESTNDLRSSKVYVSVLDETREAEALQALEKASGFIRSELLHRIRARRIPELRFFPDRSIAYSVHIAGVLEELSVEHGEDEEEK